MGIKIKRRKALQGTRYGSASKWRKRFDTFENGTLKPSYSDVPLASNTRELAGCYEKAHDPRDEDAVEQDTCAEEFIVGCKRLDVRFGMKHQNQY